jgi:hypothetical protein
VALIPDPLDELAEVVSRVEDALRAAERATEEDAIRLDSAACAAGELAEALRAARDRAPTFVAPDGHELGLLLRCPSASRWLPLVLAGIDATSQGELDARVRGASAALSLIECSMPDDVRAGMQTGQERRVAEAALREVQAVLLAAWPTEPGARVVLDDAGAAAYRRLVALVVGDAERAFAAG